MRIRNEFVVFLLISCKNVLGDCLANDDLSALNMTATPAIVQNSTANICKNAWKKFGQCSTEDSVIAAIQQMKLRITKEGVEELDKIASTLRKAGNKIAKASQAIIDFKNGNSDSGNTTVAVNATSATVSAIAAKSFTKRISKTKSNLPKSNLPKSYLPKTTIIFTVFIATSLNRIQKKFNDTNKFLAPMTNDTQIKACFRGQFELLSSVVCALSSGDATNYIQKNANGQISNVLVSLNSTSDIIASCGQMLTSVCDLSDLITTNANMLGSEFNGILPVMPDYCGDTEALANCIATPTSCSGTLVQSIMANAFAPFNFKLFNEIDADSIASSSDTLAETFDISAVRRLAADPNTIEYSTSGQGLNSTDMNEQSNLSDQTVDDQIGNLLTSLTSFAVSLCTFSLGALISILQ
jgi:hypothetical protein